MAMAAACCGGDELVDLLRGVEVEALGVVGFAQALDRRGRVGRQPGVPGRVLEHRVELSDDLVDRAPRARLALLASAAVAAGRDWPRCELVAPAFDLVGRDRLDALGAERGQEVRVENRAVVPPRAGRPVLFEAPALVPLLGDVGERETGALLTQQALARVHEQLVELCLGLPSAQEARRWTARARPRPT